MNDPVRLSVVSDRSPSVEDVATLRAALMGFNDSQAGPATVERIAAFLRDDDGTIRGGVYGFLAWQWLTVDLVWVDESLRGQGFGSKLLREAESLARDAGCVAAKLDTYEFQARPFYEKCGYSVFAVLEGYPANARTYYLTKAL